MTSAVGPTAEARTRASRESTGLPQAFSPILPLLCCPVDGSELVWDVESRRLGCAHGTHHFAIEADIPCLFAPNAWPEGKRDVTDIVKEFYEKTPFPNYDQVDTRDTLRRRAGAAVFGRMLDEQLPHDVSILEIGCGTSQMTNFLGMGFGRTAVGADICMNSLKLAKEFRDRFAINNAHFVQANLFRPPFKPASFDVVISNGVLHHTSDCAGAFRSIARFVKPGGIIIVGLYNRLGRLPTLWLRWLIERGSRTAMLFDRRLRGTDGGARREPWFMDQYRHPHETRHSMSETLRWFEAEGFDFTASIPTIGDVEFSDRMPLFEVQPAGSGLGRLSSELELLLTGGKDGGLYIMVGRKRR
jgi:ubiquinone/menaquinone biosynthesis C-methylase UbiE